MIKASELTGVLKAKCLSSGEDRLIEKFLLDSRKILRPANSVFIALITERRNAHQFIPEVYAAGVRCFLVSEAIDPAPYPDAWFIRVENTLQALQALAAWHRAHFQIPVVGITGSNGKTIVKEWLYQLLETDYRIVRSPKSFNSQIGVPISVWLMQPEHQLALFEAGISQSGEMELLERMIRPTIGIFTNIGEAHNAGFLNIRHKINEKLILFKDAGLLIYCKDHHVLHECILQFANQLKTNLNRDIRLLHWSRKSEACFEIGLIEREAGHTRISGRFDGKDHEISIPFKDDASVENAIHCWTLLLHLGLSEAEIAERMLRLTQVAMRLEIMKGINNCTLINDSYNADVSSFAIALDFLAQQYQHESKTVILSDILQSGRDNELYDEVASLLRQKKINRFIGIGESISRNKSVFRAMRSLESHFYKTTDEFLENMDTTSFNQSCILIKGARKFGFEKVAKRLEERVHQTVMEIHLNALVHNLKTYQARLNPGTRLMAMVKAFSYGSGSVEVANKLQFEGVDYLAVAYADEGIALRKNGIDRPIMVMNADEHSFSLLIEWNLEPEIYNKRSFQQMLAAATEAETHDYPIHLKLDTGMHRLGFDETELDELSSLLTLQKELKVASVFSHLSGSEEVELDAFTRLQAERFQRMSARLREGLGYPFLRHLCNSSGILRHPDLHFDMVRLGIGLYGIDTTRMEQDTLRNVSRLRTIISQLKWVPAHETVGYNRKGVLDRETRIGTVCVGYADGIPRRLGNGKGRMWVRGQLAPIVGNVCMDMCMLDLTDIPDVQEGDEVVIFGPELPVQDLAAWAETIPYEILTGISQRVKRVFYDE